MVLLGQYTASAFVTASDGNGGTLITFATGTRPGVPRSSKCDRTGRSRPDGGRGKRADAASRIASGASQASLIRRRGGGAVKTGKRTRAMSQDLLRSANRFVGQPGKTV